MTYTILFEGDDVQVLEDPQRLGNLPYGIEELPDGNGNGDERQMIWLNDDDTEGVINALVAASRGTSQSFESDPSDDFNTALIKLAIAFEKQVVFRYAKGDGVFIEERRLIPHEVRVVNDNVIVIGDDPDRGDVRAYRVDRIKGSAEVL